MTYYTGIGSRSTPPDVCALMTEFARAMATRGITLRSGHADGADIAFEEGAGSLKEIYLPWRGFNGSDSPLFEVSEAAFELASRHHPAWQYLRRPARLLMGRNGYQVLGLNLDSPSRLLVCWTPDGCLRGEDRVRSTGGTGQAIAIASAVGIPVLNLGRYAYRQQIESFLRSNVPIATLSSLMIQKESECL